MGCESPGHVNVRFTIFDERTGGPAGTPAAGTGVSDESPAVVDLTQDEMNDSSSNAPNRPTNQEIKEQENRIKEEVLATPAIGALEDLSSLAKEYEAGDENAIFREKIVQLAKSFAAMRKTRGDGNCFFRSVLYSFMEGCLLRRDVAEIIRFRDEIVKWKDKLVSQGFQALVFEDAQELVVELLESLTADPPLSPQGLMDKFLDTNVSNYMIMFFRFITSAEVQRRSEFFEPFVLGLSEVPIGVEKFCRDNIEPLGNESDNIEALALTDALGVAVRVVYMDRSRRIGEGGEAVVNHHDFIPEAVAAARPGQPPTVVVLYRPGHYDVLYPRS